MVHIIMMPMFESDGLKHIWPWKQRFNQCPWWHVPPAYIEAFYPEHNPYAGADLFVVVRNPYERIISEYYYTIQDIQTGKNKENGMNDARRFNEVVHTQLSKFLSEMRRRGGGGGVSLERYRDTKCIFRRVDT